MPTASNNSWGALGNALGIDPQQYQQAYQQQQAQQLSAQSLQQAYNSLQPTTTTATSGTVWVNSTPAPAYGQPIPYATVNNEIAPLIRLDGKDATIDFDGVKLVKEDVELLHMVLAKLKGKLAQKRASEKDLTDAIDDAVKELGG